MSRILSSNHNAAVTENPIYKPTIRLTAYKSRLFFETEDLNIDNPLEAIGLGSEASPLPEAVSYNTAINDFITISTNLDGDIVLTQKGQVSLKVFDPSLDLYGSYLHADIKSRPGLYENYAFYFTGSTWMRYEIDMGLFSTNEEQCVLGSTNLDLEYPGAIYPLNENEIILLFIDNGAIGIVYKNISTGYTSYSPSRIFHPTVVMDDTSDMDLYLLHYSGATYFDGSIFVYCTAWNGEVKVIQYDSKNWSDLLTAIPSDISKFMVNSVFSTEEAVFISGTFKRQEDFVSDIQYTLLSKSLDGITFSLERKTLVSLSPYRYLAAFDGENILFISGNRYYQEQGHYQLIGEETDKIVLESNAINGGVNGWSVTLTSGAEQYFDHPYIKEGYFSKLEIGAYISPSTIEWTKYHDIVVLSKKTIIQDGDRSKTITVVPDGKWHSSVMSYPFYMEMIGKDGVYDDTKEFKNLYKLSSDAGIPWPFSVDLWDSEKTGNSFSPREHDASSESDHMTVLLDTIYKDFPVFGDETEYEIKIYGWSRAGKQDTNPNTADSTPTNTENDTIAAILEYEDNTGNVITKVTEAGELTSSYDNFPQTYFVEGVRVGSYPIVFTITNPGEGFKLKRIGVRVSNTATGKTLYFIERIEIPKLLGLVNRSESIDSPSFQVSTNPKAWVLVDTLTLQVTTGNATNGDQVNTTATLKDGYCYAFVVVGKAQFDRGGYQYIQDPEYYYSGNLSDSPFTQPTWSRNYPPGIGPVANPSVQVLARDFPYFADNSKTYVGVTTRAAPTSTHQYLFNHADLRFKSSAIKNKKIPYVYSDGSAIAVSLYLVGSGTITNILDGQFKVYVFESPVPFNEFKFYGGITEIGDSFFEVLEDSYSPDIDETLPGIEDYIYVLGSKTVSGSADMNSYHSSNVILKIHNSSESTYIIKARGKLTWITPPPAPGPTGGGSRVSIYTDDFSTHFYQYVSDYVDGNEYEVVFTINPDVNVSIAVSFHRNKSTTLSIPFSYEYDSEFEITIESADSAPLNPQVPVPPSMKMVVPNTGTIDNSNITSVMETRQKGIPQILFSTKPYSAWNFEAVARFTIAGEWTYAGIAALAQDENNYIIGYLRTGYIGIAIVRDGIKTLIYEKTLADDVIELDKLYDLRFSHRDGLFDLYVKNAQDPAWPHRNEDSDYGFKYRWQSSDGPIATNDLIFHIGIYGLINPPKFRTVGYVSTSPFIPILPFDENPDEGSSDFIMRFPDSGRVDIDGVIYNYTDKLTVLADNSLEPMGPFQIRNVSNWDAPFNNDLNGKEYQGGLAVEITQFKWLDGTTSSDLYTGAIVASDAGYNWMLDQTQWKVWITTEGQVVWLRNRSRHYSNDIPDYYPDGYERIFITDGLQGVSGSDIENNYHHNYGTFVFIHNDDKIEVHGFSAFSGEHDQSVRTLLDKFTKIAGTQAEFIGDEITPTNHFDDGEEYVL